MNFISALAPSFEAVDNYGAPCGAFHHEDERPLKDWAKTGENGDVLAA